MIRIKNRVDTTIAGKTVELVNRVRLRSFADELSYLVKVNDGLIMSPRLPRITRSLARRVSPS